MQSTSSDYRWTIERQIGYPQIGEVAPAPDGRRAIYTAREPLMTDEKSEFVAQLYLASASGDEPRQLTFGDASSYTPRWSPDGQYVAFISKRFGKANIFAMRADGGEAWALTRGDKSDVIDLRWSRDGTQIAFLMKEPPSEQKEKDRKARNDALVWDVDHEFVQLYVVPFSVGPRTPPAPRQVTRGRRQVLGFDWLADGSGFAVTYAPSPVADDWPEIRLGTIPLDGADEPSEIALLADWSPAPRVSPDGRWIACPTGERPARWAFANRIVLYPVGGGEPRPLADTPDTQVTPIGWSPDSSTFYVALAAGVTTQIWALPASGEPGRAIAGTPPLVTAPQIGAGGQIGFAGEDFDQPNAVYLCDPAAEAAGSQHAASGGIALIARPPMPADWPEAPLPRAEVVRWKAPDGLEIEGIVTYPLGYEEGRPCPLVVIVHGGPTGVFQRSFLGSPAGYGHICALAERGYATLRANPRGSSGYGKEFRFANYGDWGGGDFRDIMAGVDHLIARGLADAERLAIMGWSYGGYMTSWAITQTRRFKAACAGAAVTSLVSFNGTADIPSFVPDYMGAEYWDDPEVYRAHSPLANVKGVTTPTLVQHGDSDVRVPLSQGRELYNALRRQGVPTELIVYPRQGHGFEEPRLIMDVRRRALEWIERYLGAS